MRGKPVPFSQGFCCSCNSTVNRRREFVGGCDESPESFRANSNYRNATNNRCNRLRGREQQDSMARGQDKDESAKKSNELHANPSGSRTIVRPASVSNGIPKESRANKEKGMQNGGRNFISTKAADGEKYSRKLVEASSTSLSPEVAGSTPAGDKIASSVDVAGKRDRKPTNVAASASESGTLDERNSKHGESAADEPSCCEQHESVLNGGNLPKLGIFANSSASEGSKDRRRDNDNGGNRAFNSVDSQQAKVKKLSGAEKTRGIRPAKPLTSLGVSSEKLANFFRNAARSNELANSLYHTADLSAVNELSNESTSSIRGAAGLGNIFGAAKRGSFEVDKQSETRRRSENDNNEKGMKGADENCDEHSRDSRRKLEKLSAEEETRKIRPEHPLTSVGESSEKSANFFRNAARSNELANSLYNTADLENPFGSTKHSSSEFNEQLETGRQSKNVNNGKRSQETGDNCDTYSRDSQVEMEELSPAKETRKIQPKNSLLFANESSNKLVNSLRSSTNLGSINHNSFEYNKQLETERQSKEVNIGKDIQESGGNRDLNLKDSQVEMKLLPVEKRRRINESSNKFSTAPRNAPALENPFGSTKRGSSEFNKQLETKWQSKDANGEKYSHETEEDRDLHSKDSQVEIKILPMKDTRRIRPKNPLPAINEPSDKFSTALRDAQAFNNPLKSTKQINEHVDTESLSSKVNTQNRIRKTDKSREFHSENLSSVKEPRTRSKSPFQIESTKKRAKNPPINDSISKPSNSSSLENKLRSTKGIWREVGKKSATGRYPWEAGNGKGRHEAAGGKKRWPESSYGNKAASPKSVKKRNKGTSTIDSPAIKPSMHLNEPLKNSPTGVSNSNKSGRTENIEGGNLNGVMGNETSRPFAFNEKRETDFESNANEKKLATKLLTAKREEKNERDEDSSNREKKNRFGGEAVKHYTPQKRTLKDLSYGNSCDRGAKKQARDHGSKRNSRRSRRQLGKGKKWRRKSKRFVDWSRRRSRRKRSKKADDNGSIAGDQKPRHSHQVYIDNSRSAKGTSDESRSGKLALKEETASRGGRARHEKEDSILVNESNRQDNVDKQIEEKFSRISDALREDTMGGAPKAIRERDKDKMADNRVNQRDKALDEDTEVRNKFTRLGKNPLDQKLGENLQKDEKEKTSDNVAEVKNKFTQLGKNPLDQKLGENLQKDEKEKTFDNVAEVENKFTQLDKNPLDQKLGENLQKDEKEKGFDNVAEVENKFTQVDKSPLDQKLSENVQKDEKEKTFDNVAEEENKFRQSDKILLDQKLGGNLQKDEKEKTFDNAGEEENKFRQSDKILLDQELGGNLRKDEKEMSFDNVAEMQNKFKLGAINSYGMDDKKKASGEIAGVQNKFNELDKIPLDQKLGEIFGRGESLQKDENEKTFNNVAEVENIFKESDKVPLDQKLGQSLESGEILKKDEKQKNFGNVAEMQDKFKQAAINSDGMDDMEKGFGDVAGMQNKFKQTAISADGIDKKENLPGNVAEIENKFKQLDKLPSDKKFDEIPIKNGKGNIFDNIVKMQNKLKQGTINVDQANDNEKVFDNVAEVQNKFKQSDKILFDQKLDEIFNRGEILTKDEKEKTFDNIGDTQNNFKQSAVNSDETSNKENAFGNAAEGQDKFKQDTINSDRIDGKEKILGNIAEVENKFKQSENLRADQKHDETLDGGEIFDAGQILTQGEEEKTFGNAAEVQNNYKQDAIDSDRIGNKEKVSDNIAEMQNKFNQDTANVKQMNKEEKFSDYIADGQNTFKQRENVPSYDRSDEVLDKGEIPEKEDSGSDANEKIDEAGKEDSSYRSSKLNADQKSTSESNREEESKQLIFPNEEDNASNDKLDELLDNYKSSTSNSDLVISPTGSWVKEQNPVTSSNLLAPENLEIQPFDANSDEMQLNPATLTTGTAGLTRALIVVDLFKVVTDSLITESPSQTVATETSNTEPKLLDRLGGLKKNLAKAFMQLRPINKTLTINETTTIMLEESTTTYVTTEETKITDKAFRPTLKPIENEKQTSRGGGEFHDEIMIDETTFLDETEAPTTSTTTSPSSARGFAGLESISGNAGKKKKKQRRKKKRTAPSMIKRQDLAGLYEHEAGRVDRSVYNDNPADYEGGKRSTRADSAIEFSFEAGNVDLVKRRLGRANSFSREQRNYLRLRVNDDSKDDRRRITVKLPRKKHRGLRDETESDWKTKRKRDGARNMNKWVHHPWFITTETSEFTVRPKDNRRVFCSKSSGNLKASPTDVIHGRILPPCAQKYKRGSATEDRGTKKIVCEAETIPSGRRLLSLARLKDGKGEHRSKDRKLHRDDSMDDGGDIEYEEQSRKSAGDKSHEKSNKRDTDRLKRKKDKKMHPLSSHESSDGSDYLGPEERQEDDQNLLEADKDDSLEESLANYPNPARRETEDSQDSRNSQDSQDDGSYNRLMDNSAINGGMDDARLENRVESGDAQSENGGENLGKDFEISLTGKIHLESDSYGRPVSISFDGEPEYPRYDEGKVNGYGNRFPSESANSFIDASDTLVSAATDNANLLPDVFDVESPLNMPLDPVDDRSVAREYYLDTMRAKSRDPRQKLLHLQKKSVQNNEASKRGALKSTGANSDFKRSLKRSKKESESSKEVETLPEEPEVQQREDIDQEESLNTGKRLSVAFNNDASQEASIGDEILEDLPEISLDLSSFPDSNLANVNRDDAARNSTANLNIAPCYAMSNITTQQIDFPGVTTVPSKYLGAITRTTVLSIQDLPKDFGKASNSTVSESEKPAETTTTTLETTTTTTTTTTTLATTTIINDANETVIQARISFPKPPFPAAAFQSDRNNVEYNNLVSEDSTESVEKKNMLAVSEFVQKLEKLVNDGGNSTGNDTGRTLIHLKKFIIVPDNKTFWSLREFSKPENVSEIGTTETVIVMGEGVDKKDKSLEGEDEGKSKEETNLIKEIINSVIRGDDLKREAAFEGGEELRDARRSKINKLAGAEFETGSEVESFGDLGKDRTRMKALESIDEIDEQSNTGNARGALIRQNGNNVCVENKSNVKREAINHKRNESKMSDRKNANSVQKKRRRKRKRKIKKKKDGAKKKNKKKKKKSGKKKKSRWPFKRNLLMLLEEEQIEPSNVDYGSKWGGTGDKFSAHDEKGRMTRRFGKENGVKEPQIRGGQDCADRKHPPDVDEATFFESAHCLRFSDLWYSVYRLEKPTTFHKMHLQIYSKRASPDGQILWKDLTNGATVRLGTFDEYYRNDENSMKITYNEVTSSTSDECCNNLDTTNDRLLVPSTLSGDRSKYSEAEGWSSEYLVVQADKINEDANECDKAGVGFAAFAGQPDRCERVSGTCLKNQPLDYWRHDIEARESGRTGCYFLSNFARVPSEAIKYNVNGTGSREFLALEYHSPHVSVIDVELGDDYNALLRPGSPGRLTEVHVDNTAIDYTVITVLITNKGSSSSSYRARITDCPKGLPVSWLNAESATKTISPHRDRKVALDLRGRLSLNEFSCSVVLLTRYGEPVARREIKVQKMDRCFCLRHCTCSCNEDNQDGISCEPMMLQHYHAAGFQGPLPTMETPFWSTVITIVCLVLTVLLLLLLLLGFLKWMIGICLPSVSRWGLDDLLRSDRMKEYFEKDLKSNSVVFNKLGQPVHPDTGRKSVRICNRKSEFFLNLTFFFIYPFAICCLCRKVPARGPSASSVGSKASLVSEKDPTTTIICVSTYGDSINSKMEAEDTKYVIDELKKSQESLQNHNRYKGGDSNQHLGSCPCEQTCSNMVLFGIIFVGKTSTMTTKINPITRVNDPRTVYVPIT